MNAKTKGARILMVFIMIYLLIPLVVTIIYSLFKKWTGILPEQFSLDSYVTIFKDPEFSVHCENDFSVHHTDHSDNDHHSACTICHNRMFSTT